MEAELAPISGPSGLEGRGGRWAVAVLRAKVLGEWQGVTLCWETGWAEQK